MPQITSSKRVEFSGDEQEHLFALIHKGVKSARVITRARILTKLAKVHSNQDICVALDVTLPTVSICKRTQAVAKAGVVHRKSR